MTLSIAFTPKEQQQSIYDWADLSSGSERVGKARCKINGSTIIIYSINIYPAWEGLGYGREFVDYCKSHFTVVIADRVRYSAIGFWEAMGFSQDNDGNRSFRK
jgi:GNAT superfamily N-acetyltransferase